MVMMEPRHRAAVGGGSLLGGLRGLLAAVDQDAALDGLSARWGRAAFWTPTLGIPALAVVYVVHKWDFYWLLREDHVVEWSQFGFLVIASLGALVAAVRYARQGRWLLAALLLLVAVTAFGMAGEEISWGQRVFGWSTPADLAHGNRQGETNLHNIDIGVPVAADDIADYIEMLMGAGGVVLSVFSRLPGALFHRTVLWDLAPPLAAVPGFAWMIVYQLGMRVTGTGAAPAILYQEWVEFGFYGAIALTVACVFARAASGRVIVVPVPRRGSRRLAPCAPARMGPIMVVSALALLLTIVLAVLTSRTGKLPGNVPGSLAT